MPKEIRVKPPARSSASIASSTESGFASVVTSAPSARPSSARMASRTTVSPDEPSRVGVPPPTKTVSTGPCPGPSVRAASRTSSARTSWKVSRRTESPSSVAVYVLKSQYPQRLEQKGTWT